MKLEELTKITDKLWDKYASQDYNCNMTISEHNFDYLIEDLVNELNIHRVVVAEGELCGKSNCNRPKLDGNVYCSYHYEINFG